MTEVLVAVGLLATGMLVAAGMQMESLRALDEAGHQQRAMRLAEDLGELLANLDATVVQNTTTPAPHDCVHALCTPPQFLADNLQHWHERAAQLLPEGTTRIAFTQNGDATVATVTVQWAASDGRLSVFSTQVALPDAP